MLEQIPAPPDTSFPPAPCNPRRLRSRSCFHNFLTRSSIRTGKFSYPAQPDRALWSAGILPDDSTTRSDKAISAILISILKTTTRGFKPTTTGFLLPSDLNRIKARPVDSVILSQLRALM